MKTFAGVTCSATTYPPRAISLACPDAEEPLYVTMPEGVRLPTWQGVEVVAEMAKESAGDVGWAHELLLTDPEDGSLLGYFGNYAGSTPTLSTGPLSLRTPALECELERGQCFTVVGAEVRVEAADGILERVTTGVSLELGGFSLHVVEALGFRNPQHGADGCVGLPLPTGTRTLVSIHRG